MRIALAQINTTVGDFDGNVNRIVQAAREASGRGAEVVVFPELAITGYPPRDLLEKPSFLERAGQALGSLAAQTSDVESSLIVGTVARSPEASGKCALNVAVILQKGRCVFQQVKMLLPTYDVFDEGRYFLPGEGQTVCELGGRTAGVTICEDAWNDKQFWDRPLYKRDPVEDLARQGAQWLVSINASPYCQGRRVLRREMIGAIARRHGLPMIYVNLVGGNDQLVFDGSSFAVNAEGKVLAAAASFAEDLVYVDIDAETGDDHSSFPAEHEAMYEALVLGVRDYFRKCGFERALIGLSGGIDSSLTAAIAVEAIGAGNVIGVAMPGPFSSDHSIEDARALAGNLGIRFISAPINDSYKAMLETLDPIFDKAKRDVTEENLQARLRGVTLMALSNKWRALVLTTGNKSELAVGYCTLYGDMCGGLAVISDVPKTDVYELCRVANRRLPGAIPQRVFDKPPSAELRPDQKDTDSLPPYETLDAILKDYIEDHRAPREIAQQRSLPEKLVRDIINMVDLNEYKRQQAAPGLKVTSKAFGIGRRFPIAQKFSE